MRKPGLFNPIARALSKNTEFSAVLRGSSVVLMLQVLRAGISFAALAGLARMIGPDQYGIFAFYFSLITLLSLLGGVGFPSAAVRFVASYREVQDWGRLKGFLRVAFATVSVVSALLAILLGMATMLNGAGYGGVPPKVFWLAFACVPILALVRLHAQTARAFLWPVLFEGPARILVPSVLLLVVFAAWLLGLEPDAQYALGAVLGGAILAGLTLHLILKRRLNPMLSDQPAKYETRLWTVAAIPMLASSGGGFILSEIDILMAGYFLPPRDVAVYQAAARISMLSAMIIYAQNSFVGPRIAGLYHSGRQQEVKDLLVRTVRITLLLSALFVVMLVIFGQSVLAIFGPEFREGYTALIILLASVLATTSTGPLGLVLNMTGHARTAALIVGFSVLLNLIAHVILVPMFGIAGSASAVLVANVTIRFCLRVAVKAKTGLVLNVFTAPWSSRD